VHHSEKESESSWPSQTAWMCIREETAPVHPTVLHARIAARQPFVTCKTWLHECHANLNAAAALRSLAISERKHHSRGGERSDGVPFSARGGKEGGERAGGWHRSEAHGSETQCRIAVSPNPVACAAQRPILKAGLSRAPVHAVLLLRCLSACVPVRRACLWEATWRGGEGKKSTGGGGKLAHALKPDGRTGSNWRGHWESHSDALAVRSDTRPNSKRQLDRETAATGRNKHTTHT
jgi:hypothetical protein